MSRASREVSGFIRRTLRLSSALALSSLLLLSTAHAQTLDFQVPGGDLKEALAAYVRQAGVQFVYREDDVRGLTTAGVSGTLPIEEALSRILAGTRLIMQRDASGAIAIGRPTPARKSADTARAPLRLDRTAMHLAQVDSAPGQETAYIANAVSTTGDEPPSQARAAALDEVLVTGTHIRGLENLTAPLVVMDREFIDSTGYTTPIQLIESLPQNFALVNQSVTGGGLSGNSYSLAQGSTISLRGVGEGTTLTLINGRRVPLGYDGSAVNIAALPLSAIERVEVLTDGASALYGSDAVGGVVNFILRREFDGAETRLRGGAAEDLDELRLSQTFGHSWNSGNFAVTGEYYTRDMLLGTDRDLGIGPNTTIGSLLPEEKNFAVTLFGRQNLSDRLELFVDVLYTDRDSENRASHATPTSNRTNFVDNTQLSATAGLALDFAAGWRAEISGGYGEDDANVDFIDPPSPTTTSGSVPVLFELRGAELKSDGPLFDLPGGTVRLAVGAQWREESQLSRNIFRNAAGVTTTDVRFARDREVDSLFTEASVPLVGEGNARPGLQRLDLSLAARYDDYSDFGSSTDPRVGLAWKPTQSLVVRGSWGTSYLAPKMREFDVAFNSALAVDNFASANGLHILQVNGNAPEGLGPQESENFTIGLDWAPLFLPGARFAVNYYDIEYENRVDTIGGVSFFTINSDPSAYETVAIFDPTEAQVLEYIAYGTAGGRPFLALNPNFTPNPNFQPGDVDLIIDARRQNIGVVKTSGFDVSASYDFGAFGGRMRLALDGSWMDELTKQITRSSTPLELLDTFANPARRRLRGQVGFRKGGFVSNAFVHYRNSYEDNRFPPFVAIDSYTTVDVNVGYGFGDSAGLLSNATIALNAINMLDEDPPPTRVRARTGVFDLGFDPARLAARPAAHRGPHEALVMNISCKRLPGLLLAAVPLAAGASTELTIPVVEAAPAKRAITVDDVMALRKVAALKVSPDGRRYAVFVRQADVASNTYRSAWFVGEVGGGPLMRVADGGEVRFLVLPNGGASGDLDHPEVQWSPDGEWIAYTVERAGEVQLWRSKADSSVAEQVSHNPSDVMSFAWSDDGESLFFTAGATRAELQAQAERRERSGYRYNEDLQSIFDLMTPHLRAPVDRNPRVWVFDLQSRDERPASEAEQAEYKQARNRDSAGREGIANAWLDAAIPPVANARGELVGLKRAAPQSFDLQLVYSTGATDASGKACTDERCSGLIQKVWWSADGQRAMFLRSEGGGRLPGNALYAWNPRTGQVRTIGSYPDDSFWQFDRSGGRLIVARQSHMVPPQIAAIDERTGKLTTLVDLNPEFRNIRIGRAERIAWDLPELSGEMAGVFPERAGGYILYPPDFDPKKKYPVFIEPYAFVGFSGSVGQENPLQVYAAAGMVVLSFGYPHPSKAQERFGRDAQKKFYSKELGFPYMTMLMESTSLGLDTAAARGFIDLTRVGIGSISMGTLVPLYLVQNKDRITAMTIAAGSWSPNEYYWPTRKGREAATMVQAEWRPKPVGEGAEYWRSLDIAEHIDQIEAPILMHHSLSEAHIALRFMRHLDDEGKPYDAYVFADELHSKWQPAHLHAIQQRNVDWFRFWLQDHEDGASDKQDQYQRWRVLREMQCKNPRSLRDYCNRSN